MQTAASTVTRLTNPSLRNSHVPGKRDELSQILHAAAGSDLCALTGSARRNPTAMGTTVPVPGVPLLETEAKLSALGNCEPGRTMVHVY